MQPLQTSPDMTVQYDTIQTNINTIQYNTIHNAQTVIDIVTRLTTLQFCITALRAEVLQTEWNLPKMPVWNEKNDRQQGSGSPSGWAGHPFTGCCGASMVHNWTKPAALGRNQDPFKLHSVILSRKWYAGRGDQEICPSDILNFHGSVTSLCLRPGEVCERSLCSPSGQRLCRDQQRQRHIMKAEKRTFTYYYMGLIQTSQNTSGHCERINGLHGRLQLLGNSFKLSA